MRVQLDLNGDDATMRLAGATKGEYVYIDKRTVSLKEVTNHQRNFLEMGANHRDEEGHAVRELTHSGWFVEVENLDDLCQLLRRSGAKAEIVPSPEDLLRLVES